MRILAFILLALGLIAPASGARAHASLVASEPADSAILRAPPASILLRFNEPVSPLAFKLIDAAGVAHDGLVVTSKGETIEIMPPVDPPTGTQTLSYRIVSADGHPVGGVVTYSIGMPGGVTVAAVEGDRPRAVAILVFRLFQLAGLIAGVGGVYFLAWVAPTASTPRLAAHIGFLLAAGGLAACLSEGLQGLDLLDRPLSALTGSAPWIGGAGGPFGLAVAEALAAALFGVLSLGARSLGRRRVFSAMSLALLAGSFATTGHASAARPEWLTRPAVFFHVAGVSIWVGAFWPLLWLARARSPLLAGALRRFSLHGLMVVPVLIAAGLVLANVQLDAFSHMVATAYGRILAAKLALVLALLALAGANLLIATPAVARSGPRAARLIGRTIAAEGLAAIIILALVSGWRFTPPPRALAAAAPPTTRMVHIHGARLMATLTLSPGRVGANRVHIDVLDGDFQPIAPRELSVSLTPADRSIEEKTIQARAVAGAYEIDTLFVPFAGLWTLEVSAWIDDFTKIDLDDRIEFAH
jgi:copper transport protein